jgi:hypothetical protein
LLLYIILLKTNLVFMTCEISIFQNIN